MNLDRWEVGDGRELCGQEEPSCAWPTGVEAHRVCVCVCVCVCVRERERARESARACSLLFETRHGL